VEEIEVGSLVIFLKEFRSQTIPNVGIVLQVIIIDELLVDETHEGVTWYSVMFGHVDIVVSSEMVKLLN